MRGGLTTFPGGSPASKTGRTLEGSVHKHHLPLTATLCMVRTEKTFVDSMVVLSPSSSTAARTRGRATGQGRVHPLSSGKVFQRASS